MTDIAIGYSIGLGASWFGFGIYLYEQRKTLKLTRAMKRAIRKALHDERARSQGLLQVLKFYSDASKYQYASHDPDHIPSVLDDHGQIASLAITKYGPTND